MKLVLGANRLFSALLKDGSTRKAIYESGAVLFAPGFLRTELAKHEEGLRVRSGLSSEDFARLIKEIESQIVWVPDGRIRAHLDEAFEALGEIDVDDVPYLACAISIQADAVWSHDRDFDRQSLVPRVAHPNDLTQ